MGKRRILAVLLAACMIVESTSAVSAAETEASTVNTVESETETAAEEAGLDDAQDTAETDSEADDKAETPEEETADKPEDAEKEPTEDTEQPPEETGAGEEEQDPSVEEAEAEEPVMEEDLVGAAEVMDAEPLADGELIKNQTDWEITDLKMRQEYGAIALVWDYDYDKTSTADTVFDHCNLYRSETGNDDDYELILETNESDGHYHYEDKNVDRVGGQAANKTYYYKVGAVYNRTIKDEYNTSQGSEKCESELRSISNEGAYYYESAYPFFLSDESDYIGAYVTDDEGEHLDSLTIKEGETQSLQLILVDKDGKEAKLSGQYYTEWHLCKRYYAGQEIRETYSEEFDQLGTDKVQIVPEMNLSAGTMNDLHVNITALNDSARDEEYYLLVKTNHNRLGWFTWQIPVHIEEGDGSYTPPSEVDGVYLTKEALCQAIRDAMVAREEEKVLYATGGYEWWNTSNNQSYLDLDFEDVFDFHRERADMEPYEGDYLLLAMGDASSEVYFGTWLEMKDSTFVYGSQYLKQYTITPSFITTKEEEKQVDDKIQEIIYQPGGALYNYQDAGNYAKIKAAYDYVRSNVSYIGTPTPIYHTCYSALINKKATCQGYALLFYRLVRELGIPCRVLMGTDANAHTYNIVELEGKWYYVDTNAGVLLKGTKDFKPATLQSQYQTAAFKAEYISKISAESYVGNAESQLKSVESLTRDEIRAIDSNLTAADGMTATYTINGATIKAAGTLTYKEGCSKYLGYDEAKPSTGGYFLALRLNVNNEEFEPGGGMTVSYLADGTRKEKSYSQEDLKGGNVNLLIKVTEDPGLKISVDYDGDGVQSKYDAKLYDLDISGLKKTSQSESTGTIQNVGVEEYGIEISSPIINKSADGKTIKVTYEAVAYSDNVKWTEDAEALKGNYIMLQLNMPESVKGTKLADSVTIGIGGETQPLVEGWNETQKCFVKTEKPEKSSWIRIGMPVQLQPTMKQFEIKWGGENEYAVTQNLYIIVPDDSALETRSESALLPGSIAFNGLVSTMYVGQNQNIHITFKKKYEADEIQVYYTSDAVEVLTVNRITGVMKALKPGTANITVSAVDKNGKTIAAKPAKITVKELPAPTGIKVASVKDTNVTVSWKANTTGTATEVYAIPYNSSTFDPKKKKEWKNVVENELKTAGLDEKVLAKMETTEKENALKTLGGSFGVESCVAASVPAKDSSVVLNGLQPEKEYLFYLRNVSVTAASTVVFAGATSDKATKTTTRIFDSIRLTITPEGGEAVVSKPITEAGNDAAVYKVTDANREKAAELSFAFLDGAGNPISPEPEFKNVKYNSTNKNIVQVQTAKDAQPSLKYGNQVGEARITVSGKDASGVMRESEPIIVRVVKAPSQLKDKSTTLMVGQSILITELIGTDLKGTAEGMDLTGVDFASALTEIEKAGCFEISYPVGETKETAPQKAIITATALIDGKSGNKTEVSFKMKDSSSSAIAKIQVKDMAAATIGKVTVKDTSAEIEFKPSTAVTETTADRYYTLQIKDKVTGESSVEVVEGTSGSLYTCTFKESVPGKTWICEVKGLSSNKAYEAVITAHFKAGTTETTADSKAKSFTTKKPLLASAGIMNINYVSLDELRKEPTAAGTEIDYDAEGGITLENNGTYVFMAQVSNLARTLETDKLKWTISSGDKKAASIKASSSSYEMQLTTTRTGIFTVTAASTVTKEAVATFTVEVIPYQSGGAGSTDTGAQGAAQTTALLPEVDLSGLFKSREEDAA